MVFIEVSEIRLFEHRGSLLDRLELRGIDIAVMIAVGQIKDTGRVLLPRIACVDAIVVQISQMRRCHHRVVFRDALGRCGTNRGAKRQEERTCGGRIARHCIIPLLGRLPVPDGVKLKFRSKVLWTAHFCR